MRLWLGMQARNGASAPHIITPPFFKGEALLFDLKTYECRAYQALGLAGKFRIGIHAQF